jgi:intracellular multiplication protein IcmJ
MKTQPVVLGVLRSAGMGAHPPLPVDLRQKIFERDDHTCRYCGFRALKYQEVQPVNGMADDLRPENLATACIFCHQCFNLDRVGQMRSGVLIWLPEVSQVDLHHIARAVYVARVSQVPASEASKRILEILMRRREEVKRRLGSEDPQLLSLVFREYLTARHYGLREKKLEGVRLFPLDRRIIREADLEFNQFPQILAYWRSKDGPFGSRMPQQWLDMHRDIVRKAA